MYVLASKEGLAAKPSVNTRAITRTAHAGGAARIIKRNRLWGGLTPSTQPSRNDYLVHFQCLGKHSRRIMYACSEKVQKPDTNTNTYQMKLS